MRKAGWWATVLVMATAGAAMGQQAKNDPRQDLHSYGEPKKRQVTRVELDLTADFVAKQLRGSAILDVENNEPNLAANATPRLVLDTKDLTIEVVSIAAKGGTWSPARFTVGDRDPILGSPLIIALPREATRVKVDYKTSPTAGALQWLEPAQTAGKLKPFLFSQSQAIQARTWIPIQDSPGVRVTYAATIRVPDGLKAAMAADAKGVEGNAYRFEMAEAIPPYLIALAIGDLEFRELGPRTGVYAEPSVVEKAAFEFADTETMITATEKRFGPYRWGRYDLLVLPPSFPFGGMENPKLTFATPTILAGDRSLVDLVAHELAHSWSGNLVTNATWRDFWLNEGFTTYLERRIVEDVYGPDRRAMEDVLAFRGLKDQMKELPAEAEILHIDLKGKDPDDAMTQIAYEKGARFLMALEHAVGRERFDAFLKGYFDHFAFRSITTRDFETYLIENLFGNDPAAAAKAINLHAWLYSAGLPPIVPEPTSDRLNNVEAKAREWLQGAVKAADIPTQGWTTQEWIHFLQILPEKVHPKRLEELDDAFRLTGRQNAEVVMQWLLIAIRNSYKPADAKVEEFLTSIGRRKYLTPLYTALLKVPNGKERASAIYAKARPGYHPIAVETLDKLVGRP